MTHLLLLLLSFLLISLQPFFVAAQTSNNNEVVVGASLIAAENSNSSWLSPSGDFAFGFQKLQNQSGLFLLAIWYAKIPENTIVWYANGDNPAPTGSKLELTANSGLVLTDPLRKELWRSQVISGVVATGSMTDTGNFVLRQDDNNSGGDSVILWQSFNYPSDTILPSQVLDKGMSLSSRQSQTNFSQGRFKLLLRSDGNLVLATVNLPSTHANEPYYSTDTSSDSNQSPGKQLVFNESGYLYVVRENNQVVSLTPRTSQSSRDFYHRTILSFDGVFAQYFYPKESSSGGGRWSLLWSEPDNICQKSFVTAGSGICGFNSICRLSAERRPYCECPEGYSLLDPNDKYGSCRPNYTETCADDDKVGGSGEDTYGFEVLVNVDWPTSDFALLQPFTEEQCRQSCLQDCMCAVAIFRSGDMCWKKKLPLSNGRLDPNLNGKALIKVRKGSVNPRTPYFPKPEPEKQRKDRGNLVLVGSVLLGCSLFGNFLLVGAICLGFFLIYKKKLKRVPNQDSVVSNNLRCFTYEELVKATNGFKEELGRGAFGIVYKGLFPMGSSNIPAAVKRLNYEVEDTVKEFKTEVNVISQTHHKNLVRLLGFCDDGEHKLLVYEFLNNGTLSSFLFSNLKPSWHKRIQIAIGIARGLLYLHEECNTQIIHCDIKPQNILLDEYYNARISDFGLAKLLLLDQSQTRTGIRGTKGYVAPEWFRNFPITVKVDVYSFGVMLLEIICCRKSVDNTGNIEEGAILTEWAYDCYCEGKLDALVGYDTEALEDRLKLERFVMVSFWCIQEDPSLRPNMRLVLQMLEGIVEVPIPQCPCPFTVTTETNLTLG